MIDNPDKVEIKKKEIYNDLYEYTVEEPYYFESCGTSYGQHIYGRLVLDNFYTIRKKRNENYTSKDSK